MYEGKLQQKKVELFSHYEKVLNKYLLNKCIHGSILKRYGT